MGGKLSSVESTARMAFLFIFGSRLPPRASMSTIPLGATDAAVALLDSAANLESLTQSTHLPMDVRQQDAWVG